MPVTEYTWDPTTDSVLEETDGAGHVLVSYTNEPSQYGPLISQHRDGESHFFHFDALGSTRELTDHDEDVTDTFAYDAWGNAVQRTGTTEVSVGWGGRWQYLRDRNLPSLSIRFRIYRPSEARWTSSDPLLSERLAQPFKNAPALNVDPSGLITITPANGNNSNPVSCGGNATASWNFTLDRPAPCDGWIVQQVEVYCRIERCQPNVQDPPAFSYTYWEAWSISRNSSGPASDNAILPVINNRKGSRSQTGIVKFFCKNRMYLRDGGGSGRAIIGIGTLASWTPGGRIPPNTPSVCSTSSGDLPATLAEPAWWNDGNFVVESSSHSIPRPVPGPPGPTGDADRYIEASWRCCPCAEDDPWYLGSYVNVYFVP